MSIRKVIPYLVVLLLTGLCLCSGGGADISNPFTGVVSLSTSDGTAVIGARVVIARQGADPGDPGVAYQSNTPDSTSSIYLYAHATYFDTTYTDEAGNFMFENMVYGRYTVVASDNDHIAIANVSWSAFTPAGVTLVLADPAAVKVRLYEPIDTSAEPYFTGARIAGTELFSKADAHGEVMLSGVPDGTLDLILYRSDTTTMRYPSLQTRSGEVALLYALPSIDAARWTLHHSGQRYQTDRPYVLSTYAPLADSANGSSLADAGKEFDVRIQFSDDMDVLSTTGALHPYSDGDTITLREVWWAGSNLVYILLCFPDSSGACSSSDKNELLKKSEFGVIIDTTAQSVHGVAVGYRIKIPCTPVL